MPKILSPRSAAVVTGSLSRSAGGVFYSARMPVNRLHARGVPLTVYGLVDEGWSIARNAWEATEVIACPVIGPSRFGYAPTMRDQMLRRRHDLLHLRGLWMYPSLVINEVRRRQSIPTIISPEGMLDPWALAQSRIKKRLALRLFEGRNLREATVLHALNSDEARDIRAFGLLNPIAILPNGVDIPEVTAARTDVAVHAKQTLLFLGRLHPKKGIAELLEAWSIALADSATMRARWQLTICGWDDGNHLHELRSTVDRLGLRDSVAFLGPLYDEEKDRLLREASAFILPSYGEGLPMSVLEAWAYRLPVLMTRQCNLPEGFLLGAAVEVKTSPRELAQTLASTLTRNTKELTEMGTIGFNLINAKYRWATIAERYLDLYRWTVSGGTPPSFVQS